MIDTVEELDVDKKVTLQYMSQGNNEGVDQNHIFSDKVHQ